MAGLVETWKVLWGMACGRILVKERRLFSDGSDSKSTMERVLVSSTILGVKGVPLRVVSDLLCPSGAQMVVCKGACD